MAGQGSTSPRSAIMESVAKRKAFNLYTKNRLQPVWKERVPNRLESPPV